MKLIELNKLFGVEYGNKFDLNKMAPAENYEDAIVFVGRSGTNNGVTAFVREYQDTEPYPAGLITVALGGAILSSFVQSRPFYTGQNIAVLRPPDKMGLAEKLYYCICIRANLHRYGAFGREANRTIKTLPVPVRTGKPNWVRSAHKDVVKEWEADLGTMIAELNQRPRDSKSNI